MRKARMAQDSAEQPPRTVVTTVKIALRAEAFGGGDRSLDDPLILPHRCRAGARRALCGLIALLSLLVTAAQAESLRIATYNAELSRDGPALLLRDILRGDPQVAAFTAALAAVDADVVALQGIDYDLEGRALDALAEATAEAGAPYPHRFAAPPNAGRMTDLDLDGDGRLGGPGDAQGYGRFFGQGAMAILSRHPIAAEDARDFSDILWRDLPDALLPEAGDGTPFPSAEAQAIQRLSTNGHWVVPIDHPSLGRVHLLTFHATPPVFDGPEDRNGKRNHDEVLFWRHFLEGAFGTVPEDFVIAGDANLDPARGDGRGTAMSALLAHPALQDPLPDRPTVSFDQTGPMRVDYVLPAATWRVTAAGIHPADPGASRHGIVWVDLTR
jgi:endonuclease/exonuclease/phosphatase family metal-dependent hydrolase